MSNDSVDILECHRIVIRQSSFDDTVNEDLVSVCSRGVFLLSDA